MHLYLPLLLHRDAFAPVRCISILLFCSTGIISTGQMHPCLPLLLHRDDFHRPDSSLPCSFHHRDYFRRPDSSLSSSFAPQRLFPAAGCITILLFSSTGIISAARMHLYLPLLSHRDYFRRPDASPACSFVPQGLFPPAGFISIFLFCPTGIISTDQMHLYLPLLLHRDYFHRPDASLSSSFVPQGLFPPVGFIPSLLFCSTGIISAARIHLYLALLLHRDYFHRPDESLPSSFVPQGLFPPPGFISIFLFCSTGIISAARIHPQLALLLHRDYFCRSNASLL